jgi:hypothetical protein
LVLGGVGWLAGSSLGSCWLVLVLCRATIVLWAAGASFALLVPLVAGVCLCVCVVLLVLLASFFGAGVVIFNHHFLVSDLLQMRRGPPPSQAATSHAKKNVSLLRLSDTSI